MGAGLKELYGTTVTFPTWSCEYHYSVSIDKSGYRAWCVCAEVDVINWGGSKDALVKDIFFINGSAY